MIRRTAPTVFILLLAADKNAWATVNYSSAHQLDAALIAIMPIMVLMTLLGGGYSILRSTRKRKWTYLPAVLLWLLIVWLTLSFLAQLNDKIVMALALVFALLAIRRGGLMIAWAASTRTAHWKRASLKRINPVRLASAGAVLVVITVFLAGMAVAFHGRAWIENSDRSGAEKESRLVGFTAYQMAVSNTGADQDTINLLRKTVSYQKGGRPQGIMSGYRIAAEFGPGTNEFSVYLTPHDFPFYPYNFFACRPSYYTDHTGKIRKIKVCREKRCPPDGPVYVEVEEKDIISARERYSAQLNYPEAFKE